MKGFYLAWMTEQITVPLSKVENPVGDSVSWQMNSSKLLFEPDDFIVTITLPFLYASM